MWSRRSGALGLIASSTPKACVSGWRVVEGSESGFLRFEEPLLILIEGFELVPEIFEVSEVGGPGFGMSLKMEHFVDESAEVMVAMDVTQRRFSPAAPAATVH